MKSSHQDTYYAAYKMGTREYAKQVSQGQNGYLPFLDGVLENIDIISEVDMGVVDIPVEKIKGTYTYLRSISFAHNFMPLMKVGTEFEVKWQHVCNIQLNEGLRDPIKVYEYLNWFYVIEGNKRASVLRFLEVDFFPAHVKRLIPKYDENDKDICIYYAFLAFNKKTGINDIWFSNEQSFDQFWNLIKDYDPQSKMVDFEDRWRYFNNAIYRSFRRVFLSLGGGNLKVTTGDALLDFIKLHGLPRSYETETLKPELEKFLTEVRLYADPKAVEVQTTPNLKQESTLLDKIKTMGRPDKLKVGFAYANNNKTSSWAYSHELGRMHVKHALKDQVETFAIRGLPESMDAAPMLDELVKRGCDVVFTTSPPLLTATLKVALDHPNVIFMNCSGWHSYKHVNTYFGRIHEPRFLCGMIAAVMSKSELMGYIATYPTPDVLAGINAYVLGARMVRPAVRVHVEWTSKWDNTSGTPDALQKLYQMGCDVVSHHNTLANRRFSPEYGVFTLAINEENQAVPDKYLATPVWNWGVFYEKVLRSILVGGVKSGAETGGYTPVRNFWWGMDSGLIDFFYTRSSIPEETVKLVELVRSAIISQSFHVFAGPVRDQSGAIRIESGEVASHDQILSMDWQADGIISPMPDMTIMKNFTELETGRI